MIFGVALGALLGGLRARKLGGTRLDLLHYAAIYALLGALLGLFATLLVHRSLS